MKAKPVFSGPDLCGLSACDIVGMLQRKDVSPAELVQASAKRIDQTSPGINAMVTVCQDRAMAAAAQASPVSLLAGLPIGIKDLTPVADVRTTYGTQGLSDFVPTVSDPIVTRLEQRGAVVMGKTNTPEMGAGANTFNSVFGRTRNPWDTRMNAGGSSGGAAAGLATGEVWLSQGSDLGGSLRTPASFCGIVGLRPSPGVAGGGPSAQGFDPMPVEGPMARTVEDCALMLDAMSGFDPTWPLSYPAPDQTYLHTCRMDAGDIRVAFSPDLGGLAPVTAEITGILGSALSKISTPSFDVVEESPDVPTFEACFRTLRAFGFWTGARNTPKRITQHYKPTLQQNIAEGRALEMDQVAEAMGRRSRLYDSMRQFLTRFEVLACPVNGIAPLRAEIEYPPDVNGVPCEDYLDWLRFSMLATVCGLPALSLPVGFTDQGLPVGIQLIGRPRGEGRLLQVARAMEQALALSSSPIDPIVRHL
ncbi:amidase [Pelagimonas varians]|uniref:Acylamidase n=1 Tax=Pelagimonas varians TaxID=696760 RepID=A0A238K106_9RHOB|nr:amidase family protein [Pelagimonas varians]PYG33247.1 amidase [Pelagimonas varians]SMX36117.1 Acylamidase [Pelagimonas varians]